MVLVKNEKADVLFYQPAPGMEESPFEDRVTVLIRT